MQVISTLSSQSVWKQKNLVARLKELHAAGDHSCRQMARILTVEQGLDISPEAVSTTLKHLGLSQPVSPVPRGRRPRFISQQTGHDQPLEHARRFCDLEDHQCRWPVADDENGPWFCAAPRLAQGPYCEQHEARSRIPGTGLCLES